VKRAVLVLVVCTASVWCASGLGAASRDLPGPRQKWYELRSPNFTYFTNIGQRATQRIAFDLELLHTVLAKLTSRSRPSPTPLFVYVFQNDDALTPYKTLYRGKPAALSGYFIRQPDANYIAINGDRRQDATGIVYHEYVHYFTANNLPGLPVWFEEGLAELYQSFRMSGDKVQLGFPDPRHLLVLNTSPLIPFDEFLRVDHQSPLYNEGERKGIFYAESWALVHYLLVGSDERRPEAYRFIELTSSGTPFDQAFASAFSIDISQLESELRRYVSRRLFRYIEIPTDLELEVPVASRPMPYADVLARLGDLLAQQSPARPEATDHFRAALEIQPNHPFSLAALGLISENHADWARAEELYLKALRSGADDPLVNYRAGKFLLERGHDIQQAVTVLRRSLSAAPGYGPAWVALTRAYVALGDHSTDALTAADRALELYPASGDVAFDLVRLYLGAGRRDDAVRILETRFVGSRDELRRARQSVAYDDIDRARSALAEGRLDEAERLAAGAAEIAADRSESLQLVNELALLAASIRSARANHRYLDAVSLHRSGDDDAARRILVELAGEDLDRRQTDAVQSLLRRIDQPQGADDDGKPRLFEIRQADLDELNRMLAAGELDRAYRLLEALDERVDATGAEWISMKKKEIRLILDHNAFVEEYNTAVEHYNGGSYTIAVEILEALLSRYPTDPEADDARRLLEDARTAAESP